MIAAVASATWIEWLIAAGCVGVSSLVIWWLRHRYRPWIGSLVTTVLIIITTVLVTLGGSWWLALWLTGCVGITGMRFTRELHGRKWPPDQ